MYRSAAMIRKREEMGDITSPGRNRQFTDPKKKFPPLPPPPRREKKGKQRREALSNFCFTRLTDSKRETGGFWGGGLFIPQNKKGLERLNWAALFLCFDNRIESTEEKKDQKKFF